MFKRKFLQPQGPPPKKSVGVGEPDKSSAVAIDVDVVEEEPKFDLYVGTELGTLKGVSLGGELPIAKNVTGKLESKSSGIASLTWVLDDDKSEKELLVCSTDNVVKTYNTKLNRFTRLVRLDFVKETEKIIGLCELGKSNYVIGLENGTVAVWNCLEAHVALSFRTFSEDLLKSTSKKTKPNPNLPDLRKLRQCASDGNYYATGGKENDLKIWNAASKDPTQPIFQAKNVAHDFLDLRKPVWIEDLTFLPRTSDHVAVATRYGQIRLYDVRASAKPVSDIQFADHPIMSISSTMNDRQVAFGSAQGVSGLYDLRNPKQEKLLLKYRGPAGSIRSVVACPERPYLALCGLDRHLYIYKLNQRQPIKKLYMKQQLDCIAISKSFSVEASKGEEQTQVSAPAKKGDWTNIPPDVLPQPGSELLSKKPRRAK